MSQRNRIVLAAVALAAALCVIAPAPSHAAGLQTWRVPGVGVWERTWDWLTRLLPSGTSQQPATRQEKEGGMINPNGGTSGATAPPGTYSDEGGAINPNGVK
jgi:hypothetical protein